MFPYSKVFNFLRYAYAQFRIIKPLKTLCALGTYTQTLIDGFFSYLETVTHMRVLYEDEICFTSKDAIFK